MTGRSDGKLGARAVIAGAGFAGLAAASAVAPFFETVTVFDKDDLPNGPLHRRGIPQDTQLHLLLKGGELALEQLLPGTRGALIAAGAVEIQANADVSFWERDAWQSPRDLGYSQLSMSRRGYEHAVRRQIQQLDNVEFRDGTSVESLVIENRVLTGLHVVDTSGSRLERADLFVIAVGRTGQLARYLADAGLAEVPVTRLGIDVNYAAARFGKPARYRGDRRYIGCFPKPPEVAGGLVGPIENDEWLISLSGRSDRRVPTDLDGFRSYAANLPISDIAERLRDAVPVEQVRAYRVATASWWHFDRYHALPQRLIPIGDSISSFNPTFGQGMTVAAGHAVALRSALAARQARSQGLKGLAADYLPPATALTAQAWNLAGTVDMEYPQTRGERPPDFARAVIGMEATRRAALRHAAVHRLRFEIGNMIKPVSVAREGAVSSLIAAEFPKPA